MVQSNTDASRHKNRVMSRANIVLIGFLLVGGFYLVTEHRAHLFGILPFLFLLLCPVMHLFMHGKHGHGASHGDGAPHSTSPLQAPTEGTQS